MDFTVNGARPTTLSTDDVQYFEAQFFLAPTTGTIYVDSDLSILPTPHGRCRVRREICILNHAPKPVSLDLRIEADADFADLFEVKDAQEKKGKHYRRVEQRAAGPRIPARDVRARDGDLLRRRQAVSPSTKRG